MPVVDLVAICVLAAAVVRGLWIGLVREVFSLAALAAGVFAVRNLAEPVATEIEREFALDPLVASAAAGAAVAVAAILAVALAGTVLRRMLRLAGLGLVDRVGGGILGAAEGALFLAVLLFGAITVVGRTDPLLAGSGTLAAYEAAERWIGRAPAQAPDVAATRER